MRRSLAVAASVALLSGSGGSPAAPGVAGDGAAAAATGVHAAGATPISFCAVDPAPPPYYAFELVTTKKVNGTGLAHGTAQVTHAASPFSVSLSPDASYEYDVHISLDRMKPPREGRLVAWLTTRELDQVQRVGPLDEHLQARGRVHWNKFLVVVTLEREPDTAAVRWSGPIAFRGMSRSGLMHTMAGHGAFQQENCAAYGYSN